MLPKQQNGLQQIGAEFVIPLLKAFNLYNRFRIIVHNFGTYGGSPHGTLDPDRMRIGDPDPNTIVLPYVFDPDPTCVLCCVTVLGDIA